MSCVPSVEPVSTITQCATCACTELRQRRITCASFLTIMLRQRDVAIGIGAGSAVDSREFSGGVRAGQCADRLDVTYAGARQASAHLGKLVASEWVTVTVGTADFGPPGAGAEGSAS